MAQVCKSIKDPKALCNNDITAIQKRTMFHNLVRPQFRLTTKRFGLNIKAARQHQTSPL